MIFVVCVRCACMRVGGKCFIQHKNWHSTTNTTSRTKTAMMLTHKTQQNSQSPVNASKQVVVYVSNYNICAVVNAFVLTLNFGSGSAHFFHCFAKAKEPIKHYLQTSCPKNVLSRGNRKIAFD